MLELVIERPRGQSVTFIFFLFISTTIGVDLEPRPLSLLLSFWTH